MSRGRRRARQSPIRSSIALPLVIAILAGWCLWTYAGPGPTAPAGPATTVILPKGASVSRIARALDAAGVIREPMVFELAAKLTGSATHLKAGEYLVPSRASMAAILADMRAGRMVRHFVSIPEGFTSAMAADAVTRADVLTGAATEPPEGAILPDSYQVQRGEDRSVVMQRMEAAQSRLLSDLWARRASGLPFATPQQAVTLASIVEKETALPAERPRIAAIFINRLRAGMRLESDPTIIYGISRGRPLGRGLKASEVAATTPYNTYRIAGLPPTPIANPGRASLEAVLNPPRTDDLYFVADGTGGHAFAATYDQHQQNVARWREIERQRAAASKP